MSEQNNIVRNLNILKLFSIFFTIISCSEIVEYFCHRTLLYKSSIALSIEAMTGVLLIYGLNPFIVIIVLMFEIIQSFSKQIININPLIELNFLIIKTCFYGTIVYSLFRYEEKLVSNYTKKIETILLIIIGVIIGVTVTCTIIELLSSNVNNYSNQGNKYAHIGEYDKALTDYNKALKLKPGYEYALLQIANVYYMQGNIDKALAVCNQILSINKDSKNSGFYYRMKILIYKEMKQKEKMIYTVKEAKKYLKAEIQKNSKEAKNYNDLAFIYCISGINVDEALMLLNKAWEIKPTNYFEFGMYYLTKNNAKKAVEYLEKEKILHPENILDLYWLGNAYQAEGDKSKAKELWLEGLKINPNYRFIKDKMK